MSSLISDQGVDLLMSLSTGSLAKKAADKYPGAKAHFAGHGQAHRRVQLPAMKVDAVPGQGVISDSYAPQPKAKQGVSIGPISGASGKILKDEITVQRGAHPMLQLALRRAGVRPGHPLLSPHQEERRLIQDARRSGMTQAEASPSRHGDSTADQRDFYRSHLGTLKDKHQAPPALNPGDNTGISASGARNEVQDIGYDIPKG